MSWERVLAETTATHGPQGLSLHLDIEPEPSEVRRARHFVREQLAGHDQDELDVITLLLSELLTNAMLHGGSRASVDISVHLRRDFSHGSVVPSGRSLGVWGPDPVTAILVGVSDASVRLPAPRPIRDLSVSLPPENGLGLQIVDQLSDGWGTIPLGAGGGKIVWFLVNVRLPESVTVPEARSTFSGRRPSGA